MNSVSESIAAAYDLNIHLGTNVWRLVSTELETPTILVEVTPEGITAHPVFVDARKLPAATLSPAQVSRVVLGWAPESQAWRLGMLLQDAAATMTDTTQLQWCELASWPASGEPNNRARMASQSLARLLGRPFQLVEPETPTRIPSLAKSTQQIVSLQGLNIADTEFAPVTSSLEELEPQESISTESIAEVPELPEVDLESLPLTMSEWRLVQTAEGLRWRRVQSWWLVNVGRLMIFSVLTVLFLILSIGSQVSGFADVEPTWLPLMGIGVGVLLFMSLLYTAWQMISSGAVIIDNFHKEIYNRSLILPFINWRVPFEKVDYILVTQTPPRAQGRRRRSDPMRIAQEVWIHAYNRDDEKFYLITDLDAVEGRSWDWDTIKQHSRTMVRRHLELARYDTPAHHAALHIAQRLDVPVYIDVIV